MTQIVRNLTRRKLRSCLTISGIVIGILALTTMGALANNFNALLDGGAKYYAGYVPVADSNSNGVSTGAILPLTKVQELEAVPGVARAFPTITVDAKPGSLNVVSIGLPDRITSLDPAEESYFPLKITDAAGHTLDAGTTGQVVLGATIAAEFSKHVGDSLTLPVKPPDASSDFVQHSYLVVGILNKTLTAPDTAAYVSLADAQQLLKEQLPAALRPGFDASKYAAGFDVYGTPGTNLDKLADRINAAVPGVKAQKPSKLVATLLAGGALFTEITMAAALSALVIGGLAVINTMIMAVSERVREIGLKKALGARMGRLLFEYLLEAMTIGGIGGLIGFGIGFALTSGVDYLGTKTGMDIFLVTPRLTALCLGFAVAMSTLAGIFPAWRAARLDPVTALRSQS